MHFFPIFCSLCLIFVFFPHFLQIFFSFFKNILIWSKNFEEVLEFWKQRIKRDLGKIRNFQKNIHPWMDNLKTKMKIMLDKRYTWSLMTSLPFFLLKLGGWDFDNHSIVFLQSLLSFRLTIQFWHYQAGKGKVLAISIKRNWQWLWW